MPSIPEILQILQSEKEIFLGILFFSIVLVVGSHLYSPRRWLFKEKPSWNLLLEVIVDLFVVLFMFVNTYGPPGKSLEQIEISSVAQQESLIADLLSDKAYWFSCSTDTECETASAFPCQFAIGVKSEFAYGYNKWRGEMSLGSTRQEYRCTIPKQKRTQLWRERKEARCIRGRCEAISIPPVVSPETQTWGRGEIE